LLSIHLTAAAALGISTSPHQQGRSGQSKEEQAFHLCLKRSSTNTLWTLSASSDCLVAKGLNGLLDRSDLPQVVLMYLPLCDARCRTRATCCPRWGVGLPGYRCPETCPLLKGLHDLPALSLWGRQALRHPADLPDSSGSDPARRAPD